MAVSHSTDPVRRCAVCGKCRRLIAFALLAESCRIEGMKLKVHASNYFGPRCARKALKALKSLPTAA